MAYTTSVFTVIPWSGGLNTSVDEALIDPSELVVCNNVLFSTQISKKKREGFNSNWDDTSITDDSIIKLHDYWSQSSGVKSRELIGISDTGSMYSYNANGNRTDITGTVEVFTIQITTTFLNALDPGDRIHFSSAKDATDYYLWFDTLNTGSSDDPATAGRTGIAARVFNDTTGDEAAETIKDAINTDASADFTATRSGDTVTVTLTAVGATTDAADVDSGCTVTVTTQGSTPPVSPTRATTITFNDRVLMGFAGSNSANVIHYFDTDNSVAKPLVNHPSYNSNDPDPPNAWILQKHLGRVWTNDKTNPDRLHYSETFNDLKWQGIGDSGAIDIGVNDGDPDGITAIFPSFKGDLFVAKRTKLYRIVGTTPENFQPILISDSIGCVSPNSVVVVDTDDIFWVSERGIHSLRATDAFGDFESNFISSKIQKSFREFNQQLLEETQAAYLPTINSVAFTFARDTSTTKDQLYLYNIESKAWYTWTGVDFESLAVVYDTDKPRFYFGGANNRVARSFTGSNSDTDAIGTSQPISFELKTGIIFPDKNIYTHKGFKKIGLFYKPTGTNTFTVKVTIDTNSPQALSYSNTTSGDLLGSTFILGQSFLGALGFAAPYYQTIDGYGRAFRLNITQSSTTEPLELQGFTMEFEPAQVVHEVR